MSRTQRSPQRWVLDTNVVLSALIRPGGVSGRLRLAWQAGLYVPLVDTLTAAELIRVLAYPKFKLDADQRHDLLADYLPWAEVIPVSDPAPATPACRDPEDLPFLELAFTASAKALVTGDADLLTLAPINGLQLITPAQTIAQLSQ